MALYVRKDDERSKLQEEIAASLRAKAAQSANDDDLEIDKSELNLEHDAHENYLSNSKQSSKMLGIWLGLGVIGVAAVIFLVVRST